MIVALASPGIATSLDDGLEKVKQSLSMENTIFFASANYGCASRSRRPA